MGLALSFIRSRRSWIAQAIVAGLGDVALLALRAQLDQEAMRQSSGVFHIDYEAGFWLVLLLYATTIAVNFVRLTSMARQPFAQTSP